MDAQLSDGLPASSSTNPTVPQTMPPPVKQRKLAIVGSRSVGKSTLTVRYCDHYFVDSYYPTIENTFSKTIRHKGQDFATEIIDTAGQDEYSILNAKHFIGIHAYVVVYSVASRQSFEMAEIIRNKLLHYLGVDWVPMVLVGNKSDLKAAQRQIPLEELKACAAKFKCAHIETSAKLDQNVDKCFELAIAEVETANAPAPPPARNSCTIQ